MVDPMVRIVMRDNFALVSMAARHNAGEALAARVRDELGVHLPSPGKWGAAGDLTFIGTAPGQWLVGQDRDDGMLLGRLAAIVGARGLLIDVSEECVALHISGASARGALTKLVLIDLHPRAMRAGDAATTVAAHVPVLIRQMDDAPTYELMCPRSYEGSLHRQLELAGLLVR